MPFKFAVFIVFACSILAGCSNTDKASVQTFYGATMGTSYSVKFVGVKSQIKGLQNGVDDRLVDINDAMSTYIDDSELNRFNEDFQSDWFDASPPLKEVVSMALEVSEQSQGAFDITVGPLVDLWGFGPMDRPEEVPNNDILSAVFRDVGYQAVVVGDQGLKKSEPRRLDLAAIAKGYGVDVIAEYLQSQGVDNFLVEIGGEMRLGGVKPGDKIWQIAVETPATSQRDAFKIMPLTNAGVATSGDYRNYFEVEGVRYSHTIDPATGYPITHNLASATVVHESCAMADAWATAMMVMGVEKSLAVAEAQDLAVYLIEKTDAGFVEHKSSAFLQRVEEANGQFTR